MNQTKKSYQAPRLTVHGDASQLTQATTTGTFLDRSLSSGDSITNSLKTS